MKEYKITAKSAVQLLSIGKTMTSGQETFVKGLTPELTAAKQQGLISIEEWSPPKPVKKTHDEEKTEEPEEEIKEKKKSTPKKSSKRK